MRALSFIGTRANITESSEHHRLPSSAVLSWDGTAVQLDCGRLSDAQVKLHDVDALIITHAHPDHAGAVPPDARIPIYASRRTAVQIPGARPVNRFQIGPLRFTFLPVLHSSRAPASAVMIQTSGFSMVYAPDFLEAEFPRADLWVGDGSALLRDIRHGLGIGHLSIRAQLEKCAVRGIKSAIFTHVGKELVELGYDAANAAVHELGAHFGVRAFLAHDGMRVVLPELTTAEAQPDACEAPTALEAEPSLLETEPLLIEAEPEAGTPSHLPAKILTAPHAELIARGEKRAIASSIRFSKYIGLPVYVVSGNECWAKVVMGHPQEVSRAEFPKFYHLHRVGKEEADKWWPDARVLYVYPIQVLETYIPPLRIKRLSPGAQTFLAPGSYRFVGSAPKEIAVPGGSEEAERSAVGEAPKAGEEIGKNLAVDDEGTVMEIKDKGVVMEIDEGTVMEIKDIEHYSAKEMTDEQLRDDWRILCAHYANPSSPWSRDTILRTAVEVIRELVRRGTVFHPAEMTEKARQLFQLVKEKLNRDGIPVPHVLSHEEVAAITPQSLPKGVLLDELHLSLHATWKERRGDEAVYNAHRFVAAALKDHHAVDDLDRELAEQTELDAEQAEPNAEQAEPNTASFVPCVVLHDAVSLVGSRVYQLLGMVGKAHDSDILIRSRFRIPELERYFEQKFGDVHFIYDPAGPNWDYLPLGDLVLWPYDKLPPVSCSSEFIPELHGMTSFWVERRFAAVDGSTIRIAFPEVSSGLVLKLRRMFPKVAVSIELVKELPPDVQPSAGLIFRPYQVLLPVRLDESAFKSLVFGSPFIEAKQRLAPLVPFTPMKAAKGYHVGEFYEIDQLYEFWARGYLEAGRKIVVEPKYDGVRIVLHRKGSRCALFTEDKKRDRSDVMPTVVKELLSLQVDEIIVDAEFVLYRDSAPMPRHEMVRLIVGKEPVGEEEDLRVFVHDFLWIDGKDITEQPYLERMELLKKIIRPGMKHLRVTEYRVASSRDELLKAIKWAAEFPGSEGAMLRAADCQYDLEGDTPRSMDMAKFKIVKEIKVQVIGICRKAAPWDKPPTEPIAGDEAVKAYRRLAQRSNAYLYRVAVLDGRKLIPIESDKLLTPADLELRWVVPGKPDPLTGKMVTGERGEWRGTNDPAIWEMAEGFPHRGRGERAYGVTYASSIKAELGGIITVVPILMRVEEDQEGRHFSWMFPIVKELSPERDAPDTVEDAMRIVRASAQHGVKAPSAAEPEQ